jgi:hypothetical protein
MIHLCLALAIAACTASREELMVERFALIHPSSQNKGRSGRRKDPGALAGFAAGHG